jgi:hypothetical protein
MERVDPHLLKHFVSELANPAVGQLKGGMAVLINQKFDEHFPNCLSVVTDRMHDCHLYNKLKHVLRGTLGTGHATKALAFYY